MATDLTAVLEQLRACRWVDLTHAFAPGIPHYFGFPDEERTTLYGFEEGDGTMGTGFLAQEYRHIGQWGTHMDPPLHFVPDGRGMDEVPITEMILPLVVLNVTSEAAENPDFAATKDTVTKHEQEHGQIPPNAFVAMNTGWGRKWPDGDAMANRDEDQVSHSPGWDTSALTYLVEERNVTAIGHDVTDTDPGGRVGRGEVDAELYILSQDRWQFELMANLDEVPPTGALIVATWPKPLKGSGFPARAFAIVP